VAAVALGVGVHSWNGTPAAPEATLEPVPGYAMDEEELWLSEDGEIAGAPTLDDVSDEVLLEFLQELNTGGVA
jgi:hypothetical protein